jgi:hypothetical protein
VPVLSIDIPEFKLKEKKGVLREDKDRQNALYRQKSKENVTQNAEGMNTTNKGVLREKTDDNERRNTLYRQKSKDNMIQNTGTYIYIFLFVEICKCFLEYINYVYTYIDSYLYLYINIYRGIECD